MLPSEEDTQSRKYLFPLNASKIFQTNSQLILDHFFEGEKNKIQQVKSDNFQLLLAFFQQRELSPLLAGYISKILGELMKSKFHSILNFFIDRMQKLDFILEHSYNHSVINEVIRRLVFNFTNESEGANLELQLDK